MLLEMGAVIVWTAFSSETSILARDSNFGQMILHEHLDGDTEVESAVHEVYMHPRASR